MPDLDIFSEEFSQKAAEAGNQARLKLLAQGIPVFYQDDETGIEIMEQPDGRKFEIQYIPGAPRFQNYKVVRELLASSAA